MESGILFDKRICSRNSRLQRMRNFSWIFADCSKHKDSYYMDWHHFKHILGIKQSTKEDLTLVGVLIWETFGHFLAKKLIQDI